MPLRCVRNLSEVILHHKKEKRKKNAFALTTKIIKTPIYTWQIATPNQTHSPPIVKPTVNKPTLEPSTNKQHPI